MARRQAGAGHRAEIVLLSPPRKQGPRPCIHKFGFASAPVFSLSLSETQYGQPEALC